MQTYNIIPQGQNKPLNFKGLLGAFGPGVIRILGP